MRKSKVAATSRPLWLAVVVTTTAILVIVATLVPLISTNWWLIRIFTFPQVQITALLVIVIVAALLTLDLRKGRFKLLIASLVAAAIYQSQRVLPYSPLFGTQVATAQECPADRRLRILVLNVLHSNSQYEETIGLVRRVKPDLFLAMETDFEWARALQQLRPAMPNVVAEPRNSPWGMMLFSRLPLKNARVSHLVHDYVPSVRAWVQLRSGVGFTFHGLHPKPPLMHSSARGDAELMMAGRKIGRSKEPSILAGDLNDVPWSATTQRFLEVSGMLDPRVGRSLLPTFLTDNPLLRWPLDHVFVTEHFGLVSLVRLPDVGSDHFPLLATLCHIGPATRAKRRSGAEGAGPRLSERTVEKKSYGNSALGIEPSPSVSHRGNSSREKNSS